ncbi:MAG TPA: hypothetical protein VFT24_04285 [Vicinamibacterales bacterium]|nr:hypothetical protein [Vicinamibacterales bacterium]
MAVAVARYPVVSWRVTSRSDPGYGSGSRSTAFTNVKIVVFAPIPMASERNRDRAETRTLAKGAQGIADVLAKAVDEREAARVTALFLALLDRSHLSTSLMAGF